MLVKLYLCPHYRWFGLFQEYWTEVKCENHGLWACDQCFHVVNPFGPLILFSFLCIVKCLIKFLKNCVSPCFHFTYIVKSRLNCEKDTYKLLSNLVPRLFGLPTP